MQRWRPCRHRSVTPDLCRLRAGAGQPGPAGCSGRPADLARWFTADDDASDSGKHFFLSVLLLLSLSFSFLFLSLLFFHVFCLMSQCVSYLSCFSCLSCLSCFSYLSCLSVSLVTLVSLIQYICALNLTLLVVQCFFIPLYLLLLIVHF